MTGEFDKEASKEARRRADKRFPLPDDTPGGAAFKAVIFSGMIVGVSAILSEYVGLSWAMAITVGLAGVVAWLDCGGRYTANSRRYQEEYEWLVQRKELERTANAERERWRTGNE